MRYNVVIAVTEKSLKELRDSVSLLRVPGANMAMQMILDSADITKLATRAYGQEVFLMKWNDFENWHDRGGCYVLAFLRVQDFGEFEDYNTMDFAIAIAGENNYCAEECGGCLSGFFHKKPLIVSEVGFEVTYP